MHKSYSSNVRRPSSSLGSQPQSSRSADRMGSSKKDGRETDRQRWREFRERRTPYRSAVLQLRQKKPKQTPAEPSEYSTVTQDPASSGWSLILCCCHFNVVVYVLRWFVIHPSVVLSSEEEEEAEDDSDGGRVESHPRISKLSQVGDAPDGNTSHLAGQLDP